MSYQHLFFDLDHTLWDHHRCANETLEDLYHNFQLKELKEFTSDDFVSSFHTVNLGLWDRYSTGQIDQAYIRSRRFPMVMNALGIQDDLVPPGLAEEYLQRCSQKPHLMPHAQEVLEYLQERYEMSIITNGFSDVQEIKMRASGLSCYFKRTITSEAAGHLKPHPQIFNYALQQVQLPIESCIMIGDNPGTDIAGAKAIGMDQIYYDPNNRQQSVDPTHTINSLLELQALL